MLPKDKPLRDRRYLDYLRTRPCVCTGRVASETMAVDPAHLGTAGKGLKAPDDEAVPLLHSMHQLCHQVGEAFILRGRLRPWVVARAEHAYFRNLAERGLQHGDLIATRMRDTWSDADFMAALRCLAREEYQTWLSGSHAFDAGRFSPPAMRTDERCSED